MGTWRISAPTVYATIWLVGREIQGEVDAIDPAPNGGLYQQVIADCSKPCAVEKGQARGEGL